MKALVKDWMLEFDQILIGPDSGVDFNEGKWSQYLFREYYYK